MNLDKNGIGILLACRDGELRAQLRRRLQAAHGTRLVGETDSLQAARQSIADTGPDLLVIDEQCLSAEHESLSDSLDVGPLRTIVVLRNVDRQRVIDAFRLGAHGILTESASTRKWRRTLRDVTAGRYCLESDSIAILVRTVRDSLSRQSIARPPAAIGLTPREVQIIVKIASGSSNREVGEEYSICERTVKHHLTNIFNKVGVSNRLELAMFAVKQGLLQNTSSAMSD